VKKIINSKWIWLIIGVLVLGTLLQWGGKTIVIMNSAIDDICQVHISNVNNMAQWGPNRIVGKIVWPNSYDIHLPIYIHWFKPATATTYYVWALDCNGKVINTTQFDEKDGGFITWQVSRILPTK
jgi:hypothetical protein